MAVTVKETKLKLQASFVDNSSGQEKRKVFTVAGLNPSASNEDIYAAAVALNPLIYGEFASVAKVKADTLANQA